MNRFLSSQPRALLQMVAVALMASLLGACGGGGGTVPSTQVTTPPAIAVQKPAGLFSSAPADTIYTHPQLRGVLVRASWSSIEPSPGVFDFSALSRQIAAVKSHGKDWSLAIGAGGPGSPAWLMDTLGAKHITYLFRGNPMRLPLFWDEVVQQRMGQMVQRLAKEYGQEAGLKLVYVSQMTSNGIEGHLQGVNMSTFASAGYTDDKWVGAAKQVAGAFAQAFGDKAIAFEVHEVNGGASVPSRIMNDLWSDLKLGQRVGAAAWWVSGKVTYQSDLIKALTEYPGDKYGQLIGRSDETTRFEGGDYRTAFTQAKSMGLRYIEPWPYEFGVGPQSADGAWNVTFEDFNRWASERFH